MFENFYAPIPDLGAYLARIGLEGAELRPDRESLDRVIRAHITHIPFENLDAWDKGRTPELAVEALFDKMIVRRRGGWCFELNGLLHALLLELGFAAYGVGVRVMVGRTERTPISHHGEIVCINGEKFYCDVGFGTVAMTQSIPLSGEETADGFRIEKRGGEYHVYQRVGDRDDYLMLFEDREFLPVDYVTANFYNAQNTELAFRKRLSVSILCGARRRQLVNYVLKEYERGAVVNTVEAAGKAELSALLREYFGIEYNFE